MGAGASAVAKKVEGLNEEQYNAALAGFDEAERAKLQAAFEAAGGAGAAPAADAAAAPAVEAAAAAPAAAAAAEGGDDYPPKGLSESVRKLEKWIQLGCGNEPYYCEEKGANFPGDKCPDEMPNLDSHNSFMTDFLKANPAVYAELKDKKTSEGSTLSECIKTGIDNKGHPAIKIVGLVACDEGCYDTFKALFDPVIDARHGGWAPDAKQPTDMDIAKISTVDIDPFDKYVLTTRVRTGRSVRGFKLPPTISFEDRRKLEAVCVKGLLTMTDDLKGDYFPLHGSRSYAPKPNGMSHEEEEKFRSTGNLFQEPDSTLLLAAGMARHWPDGRGIFGNDSRSLFVWVGEEDHLRIVSMQGDRTKATKEGKQIKEVFSRFINACDAVQKVLKAEGYDFMHNDHLGWVLTCPSNLGTGLRAGTMVNLPLFSKRDNFKAVLAKMKLQARGTAGVDSDQSSGCFDISNSDRVGVGEVQLCNLLIEGAAKLVQWENNLENSKADDVEAAVKAIMDA